MHKQVAVYSGMKPDRAYLLHPLFLSSVGILLLNDHYLKQAFPGWLTGKLSDITGLTALTIFCFALIPVNRKKIILAVSLFFTWWKSPLSEPVIEFLNHITSAGVHRVVDYSDLLVLPVLLLLYRLRAPEVKQSMLRKISLYTSAAVSLFAFCATSLPYHSEYSNYRLGEIAFDYSISTRSSEQEILQKLDPDQLGYKIDSVRYLPFSSTQRHVKVYARADSNVQWVPLPDSINNNLYFKSRTGSFYILPYFVIGTDTLYGLEFTIGKPDGRKQKRDLHFHSYFRKQEYNFYYLTAEKERKYRKFFKQLLKD